MSKHRINSTAIRAALIGIVVTFAGTSGLRADTIWDWTYSSNIYSGSGTLVTESTTTSVGSFTGYLITSMSGSWNGSSITGLDSPGNFGGNDNLLAISQPQLDGSGITFTTTTDTFNVFYNGGYITFGVNSPQDSGGSFSATATTPEPATLLLIPAAFALWGVRRKLSSC